METSACNGEWPLHYTTSLPPLTNSAIRETTNMYYKLVPQFDSFLLIRFPLFFKKTIWYEFWYLMDHDCLVYFYITLLKVVHCLACLNLISYFFDFESKNWLHLRCIWGVRGLDLIFRSEMFWIQIYFKNKSNNLLRYLFASARQGRLHVCIPWHLRASTIRAYLRVFLMTLWKIVPL